MYCIKYQNNNKKEEGMKPSCSGTGLSIDGLFLRFRGHNLKVLTLTPQRDKINVSEGVET
ncbi:hypothetical protein SAMN04487919_101464 [Bacillus sp. ok061]|nr:hypothetical protein SAMN04487919_101464 [Bacillus sp. ok061]